MYTGKDKLSKLRDKLLDASEKSINDFIKVAEQKIDLSIPEEVKDGDVAAMTDAVAVQMDKAHTILKAKKMALDDGLDMIARISAEREKIELEKNGEGKDTQGSFIDRHRRQKG